MKLAQARKIGRLAQASVTDKTAHDQLMNDIDADDIANAFQKMDFNYMHNGNMNDKNLAKAIYDFHGN